MNEPSFEPRIVGFLCNWCSYRAADGAGTARVQYPHNVRIIRLMCSGRVDPSFVLKALSIGAYFVASGVYVIFGSKNPIAGSEEILKMVSEGWEARVGGKLEFILDAEEMVAKTLEHIDKKRAELGLAEYDAERFGQSGDVPLAAFFAVPPEERNLYSRKAYAEAAGGD